MRQPTVVVGVGVVVVKNGMLAWWDNKKKNNNLGSHLETGV